MSIGAKQLGALVIAIIVAVSSVGVTASALSDDGIVKNAFDEQFTVLSEATVESGGGSGTGGGGNPGEETGGGGETSYEVVDGNKNNLHYHNDELFTGICGDYTYENGEIVSKITFNFNGGKGLMDTGSQTCKSTDLTNATQPTRAYMNTAPTRDGYTLLGWSTSATATTAAYTDVQSIPRTLGDNVTYYAVWEAQAPSNQIANQVINDGEYDGYTFVNCVISGGKFKNCVFTGDGTSVIGGMFDSVPTGIAAGFSLALNSNVETKDAYPFTVVSSASSIIE